MHVRIAIALCLFGCGHHASDTTDAATDAATGGAPDTQTAIDGSASCAIGVADGCCPLLIHGGSDPDCPSLACATFTRSAAIPIDDPSLLMAGEILDSQQGQAALTWTGDELAIAWNLLPYPRRADLVFETRSATGAIVQAPSTHPEPGLFGPAQPGVTALGYDPVTSTFLYANTPWNGSYKVTALDATGVPGWQDRFGSLCNTLDAFVQVHVAGPRF